MWLIIQQYHSCIIKYFLFNVKDNGTTVVFLKEVKKYCELKVAYTLKGKKNSSK